MAEAPWLDRLVVSQPYLVLFPFVVTVLLTILSRYVTKESGEHLTHNDWMVAFELLIGTIVAAPTLTTLAVGQADSEVSISLGFAVVLVAFILTLWLAKFDARAFRPRRAVNDVKGLVVGVAIPNIVGALPIVGLLYLASKAAP